ncbi:132_t:CDS:2, partial [Racocetra persica]
PQTIYPYQPIITRIASILADELNERLIYLLFKRQIKKGVLDDIYDGKYRSENFILAGIIPGPKEPDTSQLQNYFQPIVNELKQLWSGQLFKTALYPVGHMFRCALIQIAYDIPAAHKVTGLALHSSKHACSKWTSKLDYSNYIQDDLSLTNAKHQQIAFQYKISTSKRIIQHAWMNENSPKLGIKQLYEIQNLIDSTPLFADMGHINFKITLSFDTLTADQWKT